MSYTASQQVHHQVLHNPPQIGPTPHSFLMPNACYKQSAQLLRSAALLARCPHARRWTGHSALAAVSWIIVRKPAEGPHTSLTASPKSSVRREILISVVFPVESGPACSVFVVQHGGKDEFGPFCMLAGSPDKSFIEAHVIITYLLSIHFRYPWKKCFNEENPDSLLLTTTSSPLSAGRPYNTRNYPSLSSLVRYRWTADQIKHSWAVAFPKLF